MKNILIIESDEDSLSLLKQILEDAQYNVLGTSRIENAFEILRRGIALDLILLSTVIENSEQPEVISNIQTELGEHSIPLVALTSSARTNEGPRSLQAGCTAYVSKPIDEVLFLNTIEKILANKGNGTHGENPSG